MLQTYRDSGKTSKEFEEMAQRAKEAAHRELNHEKETTESDNVMPIKDKSSSATDQLKE